MATVGLIPSARIIVPPNAMRRIMNYYAQVVLEGSRQSTRAGANRMRLELQGETRRALGSKMARTWRRPILYRNPRENQRDVLTAGVVISNAPQIIRANLSSGIIKPRRRKTLAIPLPAAGRRGYGRFSNRPLTPLEYEKAFSVKLRPVPQPNGHTLLVDPTFRMVQSRVRPPYAKRATAKQRERGKGLQDEPVFVLVPMVRHKQTIDLDHVWNRTALVFTDHFQAVVEKASVQFEGLPEAGAGNPLLGNGNPFYGR